MNTFKMKQDVVFRQALVRIMATEDGRTVYSSLLAEWERLCVGHGKAQNNDLLRQTVGQAEGVRWVVEMLADAQGGEVPNANGPDSLVSSEKPASPADPGDG